MTASPRIAVIANPGTEQVFGIEDPAVRAIAAVMQKLQKVYPKKFAANVAARAQVSTRAVEYWTAEDEAARHDMSAKAFIHLLFTDDGAAVLEAAMNSLPKRERPSWWLRHENSARLAEIERMQALQEEEIKQLRLSLTK